MTLKTKIWLQRDNKIRSVLNQPKGKANQIQKDEVRRGCGGGGVTAAIGVSLGGGWGRATTLILGSRLVRGHFGSFDGWISRWDRVQVILTVCLDIGFVLGVDGLDFYQKAHLQAHDLVFFFFFCARQLISHRGANRAEFNSFISNSKPGTKIY